MNISNAERRNRRLVLTRQALAFLGLGIAATIANTVGGAISLLGWAVLAFAVHKLGRLSSG